MAAVKSTTGGPLTGLTTDPTDRNRLWVADGTTVYTSTDGASTFTVQSAGQALFAPAMAANVTKLYADPTVPGRLLLATVDAGLLESLDRGATWARRYGSVGADTAAVNRVLSTGGRLFLATTDQGLQSATGAEAFASTGKCLIDPVVTEVAVSPGDATTIYAGTTGNLYYSRDSGKTFKPASGMDELVGRVVASGDSIWLMSSVGLYQTKDQGSTWTRIAAGVGSIVFSDVAVDPKNPQRILLATDQDLFEGGGASLGVIEYRLDDKNSRRATGLSSSVASVAFDPMASSRVFAYQRRTREEQGVPTGVFRSDDTGNTFNNPGMGGESLVLRSAFRFGPQAVAADGTLYAGVWTSSGAALLKSTDGASTSTQVWTAQGWVPHSLHVDSAGAVYLAGRLQNVGIRKSTDQGASFSAHGAGLTGPALSVNHLAFGNGSAILAATQGGVWFASDGTMFADFNDGLPSGAIAWSVAILASSPKTALVTTDRGVYRRLLP
jgi:hypothetical protein